jgi:1,4-alpha-glucan branching enzyme
VPAPHNEGTLWSLIVDTDLKEGFYEYKYYVTFKGDPNDKRKITDPFARYGGRDNENAAFVIGGSRPAANKVKALKNGRKNNRDLIICELMIDDFTDEYREEKAPIEAITDKIDYLQELGVNAILFMPWTAWQGNKYNWGYDPYMYCAVEYRYVRNLAKPSEKLSYLKRLINECHARDIHVIMDGVFNHASPSFPYREFYYTRDDCPYTGDFGGTFVGLKDLNFNNKCTQEFIRDVCLYWIETFKIDGIRFDNTVNFYETGKNEGIPQLLEDIQDYLDKNNEKNFSLTLEHIKVDAAEVTRKTKATSYWDNFMYGKCFHYLWHWQIDPEILNSFNNNRFLIGTGKVPTTYIGNHDHSHVAWQAGARDNDGSNRWYRSQPYAIALFTSPGALLIQNGQEFAEDHWIVEDDRGSGRRVQARPLRWGFLNDAFGRASFNLYKVVRNPQHVFVFTFRQLSS